jgi:hypothetical protein
MKPSWLAGALIVCFSIAAAGAVRQTPDATTIARPDLTGTWVLNAERSDRPGRPGGARGEGGAGPWGGRPGGMGGGMRGPGGRGGMGGGRMGSGIDPEQMKQRLEVMREVMEPVERMTIRQTGTEVVFIDATGRSRHYSTSGQPEKHQLQSGTIETKTSWKDSSLVMDISLDRTKLTETYSLAADSGQLQVTFTFENAGMPGGGRTIRRVYDKFDESGAP